jgi:hypothetical protein
MTTWTVKKRKNEVKLDYELRENHHDIVLKNYATMIDAIAQKTGHTFTCTQNAFQLVAYPYLNLDVLIDNQKSTMRWTIDDESKKMRFIQALNELGNQLKGMSVLDGSAIDINRQLRDIIKNRDDYPLVVTGHGNFRLMVEEDTTTPIEILDELKLAIELEIEDIKKTYDDLIIAERTQNQAEIERIKAESKDLYHISQRDMIEGWSTFLVDENVRLGKRFTYSPTHYSTLGKMYVIREDIRKKYEIDGYIIYDKRTGYILVRTKTDAMHTPHTLGGDGTLCLGSLRQKPNLTLLEAKDFLTRTITMLSVINRDSIAQDHWSRLSVRDTNKFIEECTEKEIKEKIIDPLAEGAIL